MYQPFVFSCKYLLLPTLLLTVAGCGGSASVSGSPEDGDQSDAGAVTSNAVAESRDVISSNATAEPQAAPQPTSPPIPQAIPQPTSPSIPQAIPRADSSAPASNIQPVTEPQTSNSQTTESTPPEAPARKYTVADITDLILVSGQSNALGTDTAYDANLDAPNNRVFAFTDKGWQKADLHQVWDQGWHPRGNPGEEPSNNLSLHLGKKVASLRDDRVVGFVLVSAPGKSIDHWDPNGRFFAHLDQKVLAAINQIPHKAGIDGIIWHQGESDMGDDTYHVKLDQLIANFRQQSWFAADRPFICGETAASSIINRQLMALSSNGDRWSGCVRSHSLSTFEDGFHFDAAGLRELGRRYAVKYLEIVG